MKLRNTYKLKEVCSRLSSGKNIVAKNIFDKGDYPVYGSNGLRGYTFNKNFSGECTIIGRQGAYCGNVRYFSGDAYMTEHAVVCVANEHANNRYLSYLLSLMNLGRLSGQSAQPGISVQLLGEQLVYLPDVKTQNSVSKLLSELDDKIKVNNAINDNLQQMVYQTYMHMFFGKKPNGLFKDFLVENEKSRIPVGNAKGKQGIYPFFTSGDAVYKWNDALCDGKFIFLNTGGNADVKFYVGKSAYSTDTLCISFENNLTEYMYLLLLSMKEELNKKYFQGTGLKHLQKPQLFKMPVYIPSNDELSAFNNMVVNPLGIISHNYQENESLKNMRNYLLPLLMNGQITITD